MLYRRRIPRRPMNFVSNVLLIGIDGQMVFDPIKLKVLAKESEAIDLLFDDFDGKKKVKATIHVDVLRLPDGIHRLIRMKGLPYWYKAFEDSFTSVIRSACRYQKNPIDLNGLRRELSRHSPTEFDYDSALTTLCLDLSALCQYKISLEAHPLLIYGEKGNAASALLSLLALLRDYCCLLYTSPSPRDRTRSRMPSSA